MVPYRELLIQHLEHIVESPSEDVPLAALVLADRFEEWGEPLRALDIRWITRRCELENVVCHPMDGYRKAVLHFATGNTPTIEVWGSARYIVDKFAGKLGISGQAIHGMRFPDIGVSGYASISGDFLGCIMSGVPFLTPFHISGGISIGD